MENRWPTKTIPEILESLHSSERGLTSGEAQKRLEKFGLNKLPEAKVDNSALIFLRQFQSPLIYILFAASLIIFALGELVDGSIILFVLLFNAVVGTIQEGKAQNTLLALKKFVKSDAVVLRDGKEVIIPDDQVVPGDIIILQAGERVSADSRIIAAKTLKVDEAALTGESEPAHKISETLERKGELEINPRNMVQKGTYISSGKGRAIVVATGVETVIGKIARKITTIDTEIPLKTDIRYLSRIIVFTVAGITTALFFLGIVFQKPVREIFTTVVSLAVSIIPEGLPIVMTLVLATGVWRMSKRNVLVKKLQAVEALGQTRIIAVDKTGTITKNEMVIEKIYLPIDSHRRSSDEANEAGGDGQFFEVSGIGYEPKGEIKIGEEIIDPLNHPELLLAGKIAAFCADARVMFDEKSKQWRVSGDPTEAAMLVFARKIGFHKSDLEKEAPEIDEIPFDYKLKYHATVHKTGDGKFLTVVGAPENVLNLSSKVWHDKGNRPLLKKDKDDLEEIFLKMSEEGFRVLAFAVRHQVSDTLTSEGIKDLVFVGFFGMRDALRPEVEEAMKGAVSAGIKVVMITGDHKITAQAIAKEAGIYKEGDEVLTGQDLDKLPDTELVNKFSKVSVFARVTPDHKLRIINAYRARGEIIAMTGDGVNDAPSLVAADLGVAMGKIGTEVAKEASDIVLLDDNFGSIISAIEEGRSIYKTIKKVILYLFSTSVGEVLTITGALLLGYPLPLLAAQIIWLNLVTDGFLDVALAMEPKEKGLLKGSFKRPKKYLVDRLMTQRIVLMAIPMAIGTLLLFRGYFEADLVKAWTISLTTLAVFQWFNAWNCRSEEKSIFQMNPFSNKFLVGATVITISLQLLAVYNPVMQKLLHTTSLELEEWLLIIPVAASILFVEEIRKIFYRRKLALSA